MKPSRYYFQLSTIFACGALACGMLVLPAACALAPVIAIGLACAAVFLTWVAMIHAEASRQASRRERYFRRP